MKLDTYKQCYYKDMLEMLQGYFKELYKEDYIGNTDKASDLIKTWTKSSNIVYVLVDKDKAIGFVCMYVFDMYGMTNRYLVVDHMYLDPEYRSGRGIQYLYTAAGYVMDIYKVDAKCITVAGSSNINNTRMIGGDDVATVTEVKLDTIKNKLSKYMTKLKLK